MRKNEFHEKFKYENNTHEFRPFKKNSRKKFMRKNEFNEKFNYENNTFILKKKRKKSRNLHFADKNVIHSNPWKFKPCTVKKK